VVAAAEGGAVLRSHFNEFAKIDIFVKLEEVSLLREAMKKYTFFRWSRTICGEEKIYVHIERPSQHAEESRLLRPCSEQRSFPALLPAALPQRRLATVELVELLLLTAATAATAARSSAVAVVVAVERRRRRRRRRRSPNSRC
jgi:hypothetical protein